MKELELKVNGMVCNGCENRVKNALETIEGVKEVIANHNDGTVKVTLKEDIDVKVIEQKIEDIGFEVVR